MRWWPLLVGAVACSADSGSSRSVLYAVRDSAGVTIVDNRIPTSDSSLPWQLTDAPILSIGTLEGAPEDQLFEVGSAMRLRDGRVLVANGGTSEIRVFDDSGAYVEAWGREGHGPGEFTGLSELVRWQGDSIVAWDFRQDRLTVFDSRGRVGRTLQLPLGDDLGRGEYEGHLPGGSILASSQIAFRDDQRRPGLVQRQREYVLMSSTGERVGSLGRWLGAELYLGLEEDLAVVFSHPFGRSSETAIWGERIVVATNVTYELHAHDERGALVLILRRDHQPVPVTQAAMDEHIAGSMAMFEDSGESRVAAIYRDLPPVASFPAFSSVVVDALGYLWVEEYAIGREDVGAWTVFDPEGRIQGTFALPSGLEAFEIGADYVLGRWEDDLDIEYVRMWGLSRSGSMR